MIIHQRVGTRSSNTLLTINPHLCPLPPCSWITLIHPPITPNHHITTTNILSITHSSSSDTHNTMTPPLSIHRYETMEEERQCRP